VIHLEMVVVLLDFRVHFYFLKVRYMLFLLGFLLFIRFFILEFPVVHDPADGRFRIRGYFDKIKAFKDGAFACFDDRQDAEGFTGA
jgi:hypothetical protein